MHTLRLYIQSDDMGATLEALCAHPAFHAPPLRLEVEDDHVRVTPRWREVLVQADELSCPASALWYEAGDRSDTSAEIIVSQGTVSAVVPHAFRSVDELRELLVGLPFTLCEVGRIFPEGWCEQDPCSCTSLGWGLALRGDDHPRLISRRGLLAGPWRAWLGPDELLILQLHDLDHAPHVAWEHARAGLAELAFYLLHEYHDPLDPLTGTVDPLTEVLEIEVPPGQVVTPRRMTDAAALRRRHEGCAASEYECDHVAFVFRDEADARAHLPALWRRALQCWVSDDAGRRRLDMGYEPPLASPPAWVALAEVRESAELQAEMERAASKAVATLDEAFGVALDYSAASLATLETVFERASSMFDEEEFVRLLGAYVGEVMRREWAAGACWQTVSDEWGMAKALVGPRLTVFPLSKVRKRLDNGAADELVGYFHAMAALW